MRKKVIGLRLIEVNHTSENITEKVGCVIQEFGSLDKIFSITLDNASSNAKSMETLSPLFVGYLGSEYNLMHQCSACHIINLIVKSGLKRFKPYTKDFRTAINFLNSYNHRISMFKNYYSAQGLRPRKLGLDMEVSEST